MIDLGSADVILSGVVGSQAYGLATELSDTDLAGVYVAPLEDVLGLHGRDVVDHTITGHNPDFQYHELGKFCRLALSMNPTIIELLWLPTDLYQERSGAGLRLVGMRDLFLSRRAVKTYGGYAIQQASKIGRGTDPAKRARHAVRLLIQAEHVLAHGEVLVRLNEAQQEECWDASEYANLYPDDLAANIEQRARALDSITTSLPEHPATEAVNRELVSLRLGLAGL